MDKNKVFILSKLTEAMEEHTESNIKLFNDFDDALKIYEEIKKEAIEASKDYDDPRQEDEMETDTYRWFQIYDYNGSDCITIELFSCEVD